ncbi:MAG: hypothetical protein LIO93_00985 [Bacteroidales bacterium]|nr:hypothetical protein [Bacteroidales bacterium]
MKNFKLFIFFGTFLCIFVSCSPSQKITYNLDKVQPNTESVGIIVSVQPFGDLRSESEINQNQLNAKRMVETINEKSTCINADKLYKVPVGTQMADIFSQYLNKRMYFGEVVLNQKNQADYYITANIKHFIGQQEFSSAAAVGSHFGLIGALVTANVKTKGEIIIELTDIAIYDKEDNCIAQVGDFKKEFSGEFPADASCSCIYRNINNCLAEFNEELGKVLFHAVKIAAK